MQMLATESWLLVAVFGLWWILSDGSTSPFWPPLRAIFDAFATNWIFAKVGTDLVPSLVRVGEGYVIAAAIGIGLGLILGSSPALLEALEPTLEFLRAFPSAVILPIALVVVGTGDEAKVFIIAFGALWAILLNTIDGVRGVDPGFREAARVYGLGRRDNLFRVVLPAATPQMFAGLRVALAQSLLLMVLAELYGSQNGIGHFILFAQQSFSITDMWSGMFVLGIVAYAINSLFGVLESKILRWHRGWRAAALGERTAA